MTLPSAGTSVVVISDYIPEHLLGFMFSECAAEDDLWDSVTFHQRRRLRYLCNETDILDQPLVYKYTGPVALGEISQEGTNLPLIGCVMPQVLVKYGDMKSWKIATPALHAFAENIQTSGDVERERAENAVYLIFYAAEVMAVVYSNLEAFDHITHEFGHKLGRIVAMSLVNSRAMAVRILTLDIHYGDPDMSWLSASVFDSAIDFLIDSKNIAGIQRCVDVASAKDPIYALDVLTRGFVLSCIEKRDLRLMLDTCQAYPYVISIGEPTSRWMIESALYYNAMEVLNYFSENHPGLVRNGIGHMFSRHVGVPVPRGSMGWTLQQFHDRRELTEFVATYTMENPYENSVQDVLRYLENQYWMYDLGSAK